MKFRSVKIYTFGVLSLVISSGPVQIAYANSSSTVSISSNGDNSGNNVNITNDVNTNVDTQNSSSINTHIRIENNGQVKEYNSDKPGDVTIKSDDGNSTVHVNNTDSVSSVNNTAPQVSPDIRKKIDEHKTREEAKKQVLQQKTNDQKSFFAKFMNSIKNFFKNFKLGPL